MKERIEQICNNKPVTPHTILAIWDIFKTFILRLRQMLQYLQLNITFINRVLHHLFIEPILAAFPFFI
jgi:hypothetical protein